MSQEEKVPFDEDVVENLGPRSIFLGKPRHVGFNGCLEQQLFCSLADEVKKQKDAKNLELFLKS